MRCLASTNVIENPYGAVRRVTQRVSRYRDADMAMRGAATGFLEAQKSCRKYRCVTRPRCEHSPTRPNGRTRSTASLRWHALCTLGAVKHESCAGGAHGEGGT
jgi:hypothetical protein